LLEQSQLLQAQVELQLVRLMPVLVAQTEPAVQSQV
jgi:hypothetical protein